MCADEDGDIPPCSVMYSISALNDWESFKESKYEFKLRKAPCSCIYFEGIIPLDHKCYMSVRCSIFKRILNSIKYAYRKKQYPI